MGVLHVYTAWCAVAECVCVCVCCCRRLNAALEAKTSELVKEAEELLVSSSPMAVMCVCV